MESVHDDEGAEVEAIEELDPAGEPELEAVEELDLADDAEVEDEEGEN